MLAAIFGALIGGFLLLLRLIIPNFLIIKYICVSLNKYPDKQEVCL